MPLLRSVLAWTTPHRAGRTGGEGSLEVCTGVCTRRVSVACLSQTSRLVEPNAGYFVTQKGAYGIRTRAAAVRGRCPRPLDECASERLSVAARAPRLSATGRPDAVPWRAVAHRRGARSAGGAGYAASAPDGEYAARAEQPEGG